MSILPNQTNINKDTYFFLLVDAKVINTSTINANTGLYDKLFVNTISTGSVLVNNISSLTGNISSLNTNSISSGTGYISSFFTDSINVSSLIGQTGFISSLFSDNVRVSSLEGQTGFISSLYSDTIKVSSIEAQTANISSLNLNKAYFSSLIGDNISTNYISTNSLNSRSISTINLTSSNISSQNLNSSNIFFDTLNGTAGNITTLTGTDLVYSNIYAQILNADVTVFNSTSIGYLVANNISTAFINSSNGLFTNLFTSTITSHKGIFQSTATGLLIVNNISTGFIYGASALFNNLTASNLNISSFSTLAINVSSINTNSISSGVLNTSNITSYNITNSNLLSNAGDAQFNTLTTTGSLTTDGSHNLDGGMNMNTDIIGRSNQYASLDGTQVQFFQSLDQILNITTNELNVIGCGTGNGFDPFLPLRNNSIVNIGETQFAPGIVTIYGVSLDFTTALTVYGLTTLDGDTTINGLTTVNGVTDLNGDLTVIGLTSITGDTDIIGLTSITGNTDINGACEITGETNILGLLTAEAGIGIVGATTIQGGDITIGSSSGGVTNNFNLYCYYNNTDIENLTNNGDADFRQNVNIDGTLTANIINLKSTNTTLANISTLLVSSLIGYKGVFNSISTNYISTGALNVSEGIFNNIYTNSISTGILNINEGIFNSISTNSISTGYISTGSISADILNFKEATGQLLNFKGEIGGTAGMGFYREIDGIPEFDTAIVTNNVEGFTILSLSTISIQAEKEINISSLTNINLNTPNGYTNIQYASVGSLYTSTLNVDNIYSLSTLTSTINFNTAKGQLIELQAPPDETAGLIFYRTIDGVQEPDTIIGIQNSAGFTIQSASTISIQAPYESIVINSGKVLGLAATELVVVDAPAFVVNSNATISSINTKQITASNVSSIYSQMNYATVLNDLSANNLFTTNLLTFFIGNPLPFQSPVTFNDNLNISGNDIYNTATLSASNISTNFLSTGSLLVNNYTGDSISSLSISSGSLFVNNYTGNSISTNFLSTGNLFVDNSVENSISSLRISSGSVFSGLTSTLQLGVSSVNANTIIARTVGIDRLTGGPVSVFNTFTNNLYPNSATSGVGYGATTGGAGFYNQGNFRSTFTQVIQGSLDNNAFSNIVRINGNVSTQNIQVSTINRKLYPTRSTIGGPFFPSSFTLDGTTATTPQLLISSINFFAGAGNYDISQRMAFIKLTGGNSVDAHGSILVASTNTLLIPDSNTGYGQLPQVNDVGHSTFTTLYTSITVGTNSFQRQYKYLDTTGGNYTGSLYLERPVITYIPSQGLNPE